MSRPVPALTAPLCRQGGHTCAACCWGEEVSRATLRAHLRRHARWFRHGFAAESRPGRYALLLYEVVARGGLDLLLALLLLVPGLGDWLRPWLRRRLVCAFVGFEDPQERRVGCLLHPTRWDGRDIRPQVAFALLPGFACGSPDYYCLAAHWFARAPWHVQQQFARQTASLDWYAFSQAASKWSGVRSQSTEY